MAVITVIQLISFFLFLSPNQVLCDRNILDRYERQLNYLSNKMNNGKPVIVNGKMKRYKCVEEYVLLDEYGQVIAEKVDALKEDGQSNKDHFVEPKTRKSAMDVMTPPERSMHASSIANSKKEPKIGIFESRQPATAPPQTTTTTTTPLPSVTETRTKMPEMPISHDGLNIRRLSPKAKAAAERQQKLQPLKISDDMVPFEASPDLQFSSRQKSSSSRSSPSRYLHGGTPSYQRDYDDYQYYETDRDYPRRPNYVKQAPGFYRSYGERQFELDYPRSSRGESRRYPSSRFESGRRMRMSHSRESDYERNLAPMRRKYATSASQTFVPADEIEQYDDVRPKISSHSSSFEDMRPLPPPSSSSVPHFDNHRNYLPTPQPRINSQMFPQHPHSHPQHYQHQMPSLQPLPTIDLHHHQPQQQQQQQQFSQPMNPLPPVPLQTTPPQPPVAQSKDLQMNPENCSKVKNLASSWQITNPEKWIRENCLLALSFAPQYSCEELAKFVSSCKSHHFL